MAVMSAALILLCSSLASIAALYVDHGDPYLPGTLPTTQFTLTETMDHAPLHSMVIVPTTPGDYAVAFFVSGMDGVAQSEMYQAYLNSVAQHGFVVIGSDYIWPAIRGEQHKQLYSKRLGFITDKFMEQFFWLKKNLQGHITVANVTGNWDHVALFSHSAGADAVFKMAKRNHTLFQSVVFYEPMSFMFNEPTDFSLPALVIGTQLSTVYHDCVIPGFGYNHFYKMWALPPKVLMNVKNFGHCDILDNDFREFCADTKLCLCGNSTSIGEYKRFAQGVTSAFFITTLQGNQQDLPYLTNEKNIPLPLLEFKYNMTSHHRR